MRPVLFDRPDRKDEDRARRRRGNLITAQPAKIHETITIPAATLSQDRDVVNGYPEDDAKAWVNVLAR
jgi:hypothetical protein